MHAYLTQFLTVAVAHLLAVASPGPDFAMVLRQSLAEGRRVAIWTSIGIGSAILLHVGYSLLGIGIVIRSSPVAFAVLKAAGAGYLAWIGLKALRSPARADLGATPAGLDAGARGAKAPGPTPRAAWTAGFLTNALNPKATLFFVALFSTVVDPRTPRIVLAAYGAWMSLATMAWFSIVSVLFTRDAVRRAFLRGGHWIDRAMGVVFLGFAAVLALASIR